MPVVAPGPGAGLGPADLQKVYKDLITVVLVR